MSDRKKKFHIPDTPEEINVDELIAQTRQQISSEPGELPSGEESYDIFPYGTAMDPYDMPVGTTEEGSAGATEETTVTPEETDFVPDFGAAFDDYGTYEEESPLPTQDDQPDPELTKPKKKRKKRMIPLFVKVLLYLVIVGVAAVGFGYGAWECAKDVLAFGKSDVPLTVTIADGDTVDDIAQMLKEKGAIKYPWLFKLYCSFTDSGDIMDPGTYELSYNYDYNALVKGMVTGSGNRTEVRVMIPEGATLKQVFELMEKNNVCTAQELTECAAQTEFDYWFLEGLPYGEATRLEGYLFPDTYDFYEADEPERVLDKLLSNFNRKFTEEAQEQLKVLNEQLAAKLSNAGYDSDYIEAHKLSVHDLVIVASMIEKETANASESVNVASVMYNRLCSKDFPYLQIDATVVYALGGIDGAVTYEDTQVDSPYNTYKYGGLPVGPISNPGLSSITAALHPADTNYYYYALDESTGTHHFSETYEEHNSFLEGQNYAD